jgi:hypothetical protein
MAGGPGLSRVTPGIEAFGVSHWRRRKATDKYGGSGLSTV